MDFLVWAKLVMYVLCVILAVLVNRAALYGIQARKYPAYRALIVKTHMRVVFGSVATVFAIVYIVEFIIRPHIPRHFSLLFDAHLLFCGMLIASGASAITSGFIAKKSLSKKSWHRVPARATWLFGNLVSITGAFVTYYLRSS